jgi:SAM-dependent methyltransferase
MAIYQQYAPFYDGSGQIRFAVLVEQYLRELLQQHHIVGNTALDLACGTGTLALMLADAGWQVVGVDQSAAMLALARHKAETLTTSGQAEFIQGDLRLLASLALPVPHVALATCFYDSLNYLLTEADLLQCFVGVQQILQPGGLFIADLNTRHFLEHEWGTCEVEERPGFVQIMQSHFDPATAQSLLLLTGFVGDDQQGYQRFDEIHVERGYPLEIITALLTQAGLHVEATYDCFTFQPVMPQTQRIAFVARRPDKLIPIDQERP